MRCRGCAAWPPRSLSATRPCLATSSRAYPRGGTIARRSVVFFEHPQGKIYDTVEYTSIIVYFYCIFMYFLVFACILYCTRLSAWPARSSRAFPHNGGWDGSSEGRRGSARGPQRVQNQGRFLVHPYACTTSLRDPPNPPLSHPQGPPWYQRFFRIWLR